MLSTTVIKLIPSAEVTLNRDISMELRSYGLRPHTKDQRPANQRPDRQAIKTPRLGRWLGSQSATLHHEDVSLSPQNPRKRSRHHSTSVISQLWGRS